jgi:hypothetical protein
MVAESTTKLVSCLEKLAGLSNSNGDEKMQKMQDQIDNRFATLDNKLGSLDSKFDSLLAVMQQIVEKKVKSKYKLLFVVIYQVLVKLNLIMLTKIYFCR